MKNFLIPLAFLVALECQAQMKNEMKAKTIEVVTFNLKEGVSKEEGSKKLATLNDLVRTFDGFIKRSISCNEQGKWVDIVYWTSKELAPDAAKSVAENPTAMEAFQVIDENSIQMNHYEIINSLNE